MMPRFLWILPILAGCTPAPAPEVAVGVMASPTATPVASPTLASTYARVIDRRVRHPAPRPSVQPPPPIPAGEPSFGGLVLGGAAGQEAPIPGALVHVADGRYAVTDAAGRFTLPGRPPADGVYLASCAGYVASAVQGFPADQALVLHLQAVAAVDEAPELPAPFEVSGQVLDGQGQPAADVAVVLGDAAGASCVPVLTGPDGKFTLDVTAPAGQVAAGSLIAAGPAGQAYVADVAAGPGGTLAPVTLAPASHRIRLELDGSAMAAPLAASVVLLAPDATRLALEPVAGVVNVAPLPGLRRALRLQAVDATGASSSAVRRDDLALDLAAGETVVRERLLAPPQADPPAVVLEGLPLAWGAVAGATGYQVALAAPDAGGPVWETYAAAPGTALLGLPALRPGRYELTISAWDEPDQAVRTVASVARDLRALPLGASYRVASRRFLVGPP